MTRILEAINGTHQYPAYYLNQIKQHLLEVLTIVLAGGADAILRMKPC